MNQEEVLRTLETEIGEYKLKRDEAAFRDCPFCENTRWNFEVNVVKWVYHCWACSCGGSVRWLVKQLHIDVEVPEGSARQEQAVIDTGACELPARTVAVDKSADSAIIMQYLKSRGLTPEDAVTYGMLWWDLEGRIVFPFKNDLGNLIFWTARTIYKHVRPKYVHPAVPKANKVIVYRGTMNDKSLYIVEGVFDAIRVHKMGYSVLILLGTEISTTVVDFLRAGQYSVTLCLDNDAASKQLKYEEMLGSYLGKDRVKALYLSGKDVAEVGLTGSEGFGGYIRSRIK